MHWVTVSNVAAVCTTAMSAQARCTVATTVITVDTTAILSHVLQLLAATVCNDILQLLPAVTAIALQCCCC